MTKLHPKNKWICDILQHIEDNDNTTLPQINLVFEQDTLPIFTDQLTHKNVYIYQDSLGYEMDDKNIFIHVNDTTPTTIHQGNIIDDKNTLHLPDDIYTNTPQTSYICGPPSHQDQPNVTFVDHIDATITSVERMAYMN